MKRLIIIFLLIFAVQAGFVRAAGPSSDAGNNGVPMPHYGHVIVKDTPIEINLPHGFVFYDEQGAKKFLFEYQQADSSAYSDVIGMILRDSVPTANDVKTVWLLRYYEGGHVIDNDGARLDFAKILKDIRGSEYYDDPDIKWGWQPKYVAGQHRLSMPLFHNKTQSYILQQYIFGNRNLVMVEVYGAVFRDGSTGVDDELICSSIGFTPGSRYEDYDGGRDDAEFQSMQSFIESYYVGDNSLNRYLFNGIFFFNILTLIRMAWIAGAILILIVFLLLMVKITNRVNDSRHFGFNDWLRFATFLAVDALFFVLHIMSISAITIGFFRLIPAGMIIILGWIILGVYVMFKLSFVLSPAKDKNPGRIEIKPEQAPRLFELIAEVAKESGYPMPKHVYASLSATLSLEVKRSMWHLYRKQIVGMEIGLGLLYGLNSRELMALMAKEYGLLAPAPKSPERMRYICYRIVNTLVYSGMDEIENSALHKIANRLLTGRLLAVREKDYASDRLSARIAGPEAAISAIYKTEAIATRFKTFMDLVCEIQDDKKRCPQLLKTAYLRFLELAPDLDDAMIDASVSVEVPLSYKPVRRLQLDDAWFLHPTIADRVRTIRALPASATHYQPADITELIPEANFEWAYNRFREEVDWNFYTICNEQEYSGLLELYVANLTFSARLRPFFNRDIIPFDLGSIDIADNVLIDNDIFSDDNARFMLDYEQILAEYKQIEAFKHNSFDKYSIQYEGSIYTKKNAPVDAARHRLDAMQPRAAAIDAAVYHYALAETNNKVEIYKAYDNIFYSQKTVDRLNADIMPYTRDLQGYIGNIENLKNAKKIEIQQRLRDLKKKLLPIISELQLYRLNPIMPADFTAFVNRIYDEKLFSDTLANNDEALYIYRLSNGLLEQFESLNLYSKKIITDVIEGNMLEIDLA